MLQNVKREDCYTFASNLFYTLLYLHVIKKNTHSFCRERAVAVKKVSARAPDLREPTGIEAKKKQLPIKK